MPVLAESEKTDIAGIVCFGYGYVAQALASGHPNIPIVATKRTVANQQSQNNPANLPLNFPLILPWQAGDRVTGLLAQAIDRLPYWLISFPPADGALPDRTSGLKKVIYLSSSAVYGDHAGRVVTETSATLANSNRGKRRLLDEQKWTVWADKNNVELVILRLAGIYGPGRNSLERLRAGQETTWHRPGHKFNRIHVADIVAAIMAGIDYRGQGVFNLADDYPAEPSQVCNFAANLLGLPAPQPVAVNYDSMPASVATFWRESKLLSNNKIKQAMDYQLIYPSYREGLSALLQTGFGQAPDNWP